MSLQRDEVHKDLPTINEGQELKGLATDAWIGLFAPARTPAATVDRLNAALQQTLNKPEVREGLAKLGFRTSAAVTPAKFRRLVEQDDVRYRQATAGIRWDR
jgi:tripartite-type tricarboxylate transporter receptor subunit TctC